MTLPKSPGLKLPAMLHGLQSTILREVRAKGRQWAREYLKTRRFAPRGSPLLKTRA